MLRHYHNILIDTRKNALAANPSPEFRERGWQFRDYGAGVVAGGGTTVPADPVPASGEPFPPVVALDDPLEPSEAPGVAADAGAVEPPALSVPAEQVNWPVVTMTTLGAVVEAPPAVASLTVDPGRPTAQPWPGLIVTG